MSDEPNKQTTIIKFVLRWKLWHWSCAALLWRHQFVRAATVNSTSSSSRIINVSTIVRRRRQRAESKDRTGNTVRKDEASSKTSSSRSRSRRKKVLIAAKVARWGAASASVAASYWYKLSQSTHKPTTVAGQACRQAKKWNLSVIVNRKLDFGHVEETNWWRNQEMREKSWMFSYSSSSLADVSWELGRRALVLVWSGILNLV